MTLRDELLATLKTYEEILYELREYKSNEYKQGLADGLEMMIDAIKVCLEDNEDNEEEE